MDEFVLAKLLVKKLNDLKSEESRDATSELDQPANSILVAEVISLSSPRAS